MYCNDIHGQESVKLRSLAHQDLLPEIINVLIFWQKCIICQNVKVVRKMGKNILNCMKSWYDQQWRSQLKQSDGLGAIIKKSRKVIFSKNLKNKCNFSTKDLQLEVLVKMSQVEIHRTETPVLPNYFRLQCCLYSSLTVTQYSNFPKIPLDFPDMRMTSQTSFTVVVTRNVPVTVW